MRESSDSKISVRGWWMMVTIVMPKRERALSVFMMDAAAVASRPDVGSSRKSALF